MNQSYRLVWSAVRGAWAVVSELTKSHAKSLIQLGALSQKITVNTGQEQGLLVANSGVEIGRLNLTQIRAKNKGEAIQLSNDGLLHVKELVFKQYPKRHNN
jgi:hypothetical protein